MKFKKSMLILILAIFLVSIAGVCASDVNDTAVASEDANQIDVSSNDAIVEDSLKTSEENTTLAQTNDDDTLSAESGSQILGDGEGTYYDLRDEIGDGGDKSLAKSYYSYTGGDTIEITKSGVINGNGAVIDMAGSNIRAFYVSASDVTIKNLTIKNANYSGYGGAIYFSGSGTVENCTFTGNTADFGGVMYHGSAVNCTFIGNSARTAGAMASGYAVNCTFIGNSADHGGAMSRGSAVNCTFTGNSAMYYGGAMSRGSAVNCTFTGNSAMYYGGAMYLESAVLCIFETSSDTFYYTNIPTFTVSKSILSFDSGDKLLFNLTCDNNNYDGYNTTITLTKNGDLIGVYYALSGSDDGWVMDLSPGAYRATLSMEPYAINPVSVAISVGVDMGTYSGLSGEIGSGENYIELQHDYYIYDYGSAIELNNPNTVIDGKGAVIDMFGSNIRAFTVSASNVTIKNLTIRNANFDGRGGAIYNNGILTITFTNLTDNKARYGGAIYNAGILTVTNTNLTNNTAYNGGAIYNCLRNCTVVMTIKDNNFTDNSAENNGGAIYNYLWCIEGTTTIKDNNFTGNMAEDGTAIYTDYKYVDLQSIDLESNSFNGNNYTFNTWGNESITVVGNTFEDIQNAVDNAKDDYTIYLDEKTYFGSGNRITIDKNVNLIGKNTIFDAQYQSGMLYISENVYNITLQNIQFINGSGKYSGDGVIECFGYNLNMVNCTVRDYKGRVVYSFAIFVSNRNANVSILNSSFINNTVTDFISGNMYFDVNNLVVDNCNFINNSLPADQIGAWARFATTIQSNAINSIITNCLFDGCYKEGWYGHIKLCSQTNTIINCTFINNVLNDSFVDSFLLSSVMQGIIDISNYGVNYTNHDDEYRDQDGNRYNNPNYFYNNTSTYISNCKFNNNTESTLISYQIITEYRLEHNQRIEVDYCDMTHNLTIEDCDFKNCNFIGSKTAIFLYHLTNFNLKDSTFDNITADTVIEFSTDEHFRKDCNDALNISNSNFTNISGKVIHTRSLFSADINYSRTINVIDCNFVNYGGEALYDYVSPNSIGSFSVLNCNFINGSGYGIYGIATRNLIIDNCNFTNSSNTAIFEEIYSYSSHTVPCDNISVNNCNFFNNHGENGGAIHIEGSNNCITNCRFENNSASDTGAIYISCPDVVLYNVSVINCTFNNNFARYCVGAASIGAHNSILSNCNFTNNHCSMDGTASFIGTIVFGGDNSVIRDCNFINSSAGSNCGVGSFAGNNMVIKNCNFTNVTSTRSSFEIKRGEGILVSGCNFLNLSLTNQLPQGCIILSTNNTKIEKCNFTDCSSINRASVIWIPGWVDDETYSVYVNLTFDKCIFTNNHIYKTPRTSIGSTILAYGLCNSTISNCAFVNNAVEASEPSSGAILLGEYGGNNSIINCSFENNSAVNSVAGAILLQEQINTIIINSTFKANKASSRSINVERCGDSIVFSFEGYEQYIHAIEADDQSDVHFYNVTYWDGEMLNTDDVTPRKSYLQSNQEIVVEIYDSDGVLVDSFSAMTDSNGQAVYDCIGLPLGTYNYFAFHPDNDYYTYINTTGSFTLDNSFTSLYEKICLPTDSISLRMDYVFDSQLDSLLTNGMVIDKNITINGNGHSIDAGNLARIFNITDSGSMTLVNVTLTNAKGTFGAAIYNTGLLIIDSCIFKANIADGTSYVESGTIWSKGNVIVSNSLFEQNFARYNGGAIWMLSGSVINCNFTNNTASGLRGGAVYFKSNGDVANCNFIANKANSDNGGAVYFEGNGTVTNCNFTNNSAGNGGAVFFKSNGTVTNCNFANNYVTGNSGGAVYFDNYVTGTLTNCNFTNNSANNGGALLMSSGSVINCNFIGNNGTNFGGAIYFSGTGNVSNCNFTSNTATNYYGGAVFFNRDCNVTNCNFTSNTATNNNGGAVYFNRNCNVTNCNFTDNKAESGSGGAVYFNRDCNVTNCNFTSNAATNSDGGAVYFHGSGSAINCSFTDNKAKFGGAVYNYLGNLTIIGSNLTSNYASEAGAGVYNNGGNVTINNSTLKDNHCNLGSAIWTSNGDCVELNNVRIVDNEGEALHSNDGVAIDTSGVKFLTAVSFKIEDINDTLNGCEITINVTELNKGKEFSGNVTVFIGDENYTVEIINGTGLRNVTPKWGLKTYTVRLTFNETDVYYSATAEGNPFHIRTNPTITISNIGNVDEGTQITVKVSAVDSFNRDLIVIIAGENYIVSMTNGSGERAITLAPGTYEATITFPESNCYTADNAKSNQFIVRKNPRISIAEIANVIQGTPITIKVTAVASFNGELVIAINGENYTVNMTNGSGERTVTLAPGSYNATISFTGNDYYTASSAQSNGFTVSKETTSITANALTVVYNANKQLVITLKDSKGKPISGQTITVNLNGAKTLKTDKNGQVKVPTKGLAAKTYTAKITFKGNANYIASSKNVKVTVKKATPKLTAKSKKFKKSVKVKKYTVTLKDNTGKAMKKVQLTIKIGKKTYKAKTNNKGKATFKIKKLTKKGKYTAVIKYKGNKNYNKVTKKVKITVK